jgi:hypothetical protein
MLCQPPTLIVLVVPHCRFLKDDGCREAAECEIGVGCHAAALIRGVIWHASGWPLIGLVRRWKETRSPTAGEYSATTQGRRKKSTAPESSSAWMTPHPVSGLYILICPVFVIEDSSWFLGCGAGAI